MAFDYEIAVIGAGPGGYETAIRSAQLGKKTCIIENTYYGGTCLNVGCIPTKALIKTADLIKDIRSAGDYAITGLDKTNVAVNMEKLQARKKAVVSQLTGGVKSLLGANKVTMINGTASFVDAHTLKVNDVSVTAENIIIATGSTSFMPPFIAYEGDNNILTSTEALELSALPDSMAIIGGGVIGIEFAYLFSLLGVKIHVIELMDHILPMVDHEISAMAQKALAKEGVNFQLSSKVKKVADNSVIYEYEGEELSIKADAILMAVGRIPNTDSLNAAEIGLEFNKKAVKTDSSLRTNIDNIYAIGDVNGQVMLAHTASHEGMVALANICNEKEQINYDHIPSCIYINPEISCIGLTEQQAMEKYPNIKVGRFPMMANGKSLVEGDTNGLIKIILEAETGEILGVHIMAQHATEMIGEVSVAMANELTAEEIINSIHPHPTVNEALGEAFMAAWRGKAINNI